MAWKERLTVSSWKSFGDATVKTPNAELHKKLSFRLGVYISNKNFEKSNVAQFAKEFKTKLQVFEYAEFLNGRLIFPFNKVKRNLPEQFSMLSTSGNYVLSTVKKADQRSGYIARLYNASFNEQEDLIKFVKKPQRVELVNLHEDKVQDLYIRNDGSVKLPKLKHDKILTLYFEYK